MDLCVEMGEPDINRMMDRLGDARMLAVWQAYWRENPFGYIRHNLHAILAASAFCKEMPPTESLLIRDRTPEFDELFAQHKARQAEHD